MDPTMDALARFSDSRLRRLERRALELRDSRPDIYHNAASVLADLRRDWKNERARRLFLLLESRAAAL